MNKRSAMTIAAGLVAALLAGVAAFSLSLGSSATPASASGKAHRKPIVRTIERTVTVEKKAKDASSGAQVVTLQAPSSPDGSGDDQGDDDAFEGQFEGGDDDGFEDDNQSDDHGSENHSGSDDGGSGGEFEGGDD